MCNEQTQRTCDQLSLQLGSRVAVLQRHAQLGRRRRHEPAVDRHSSRNAADGDQRRHPQLPAAGVWGGWLLGWGVAQDRVCCVLWHGRLAKAAAGVPASKQLARHTGTHRAPVHARQYSKQRALRPSLTPTAAPW
jgi:hypothetical protein